MSDSKLLLNVIATNFTSMSDENKFKLAFHMGCILNESFRHLNRDINALSTISEPLVFFLKDLQVQQGMEESEAIVEKKEENGGNERESVKRVPLNHPCNKEEEVLVNKITPVPYWYPDVATCNPFSDTTTCDSSTDGATCNPSNDAGVCYGD